MSSHICGDKGSLLNIVGPLDTPPPAVLGYSNINVQSNIGGLILCVCPCVCQFYIPRILFLDCNRSDINDMELDWIQNSIIGSTIKETHLQLDFCITLSQNWFLFTITMIQLYSLPSSI